MSNRLTFSLASLFLIFGLVFATAPVMAQIDAMLYFGDAGDSNAPDANAAADAGADVEIDAALTIPANGHVVITKGDPATRSGAAATPGVGLPATTVLLATQVVQWTDMPNLEELFFGDGGGTILLKGTKTAMGGSPAAPIGDGTATASANIDFRLVDHDKDDQFDGGSPVAGHSGDGIKDTADNTANAADAVADSATRPVDIRVNDLAITEIMWALDNAVAGEGTEGRKQWIEIYNRTNVPITLTGVILHLQSGRPPLGLGGTDQVLNDAGTEVTTQGRTVLDRITNVSGGGWTSPPPGQNGFTADDADDRVEFISMYRQRDKLDQDHGSNRGHWHASTNVYLAGHKGTPGKAERTGPVTFTTTTIPRSPIIFNEIANREGADYTQYEWIELRNVSDGEVNLKNWQISIVTAKDSDKEFFNFYDKDLKVPAGGILLLVVSDPSENPDHPLAAGFNIEKGADDQANGVGPHSPRYLVMKSVATKNDARGLQDMYVGENKQGLPDDGMFVLILRNGLDKEGKAEKLIDIAGYDTTGLGSTGALYTNLWPLVNYPAPDIKLNELEKDKVHRRQHADIDGTRTKDKKDNADHVAFRDIGWTGVGYKRNAMPHAKHGGTPGYPNGALVSEGANATDPVIISEIMFNNNRNFSQWIELHNTSKTHGVNIDNWSIFIVNHNDTADGGEYQGKLSERIDLDGKIPPGQTYLIVSRRGSHDTKLPAARIHSANRKRTETILNPYGFQITLKAKTNEGDANKHQTVDMVGNLGAAPENTRRADAQSFEELAWMLPAGMNDDGNRVSINRVPGKKAMMTDGGRIDGMMKQAWKRFDMTEQITLGNYYGHSSDIGSPGHTTGGVLPVSLSKFRPERMKDTGEIVIRWVTESELNNAGFNILRSEKRDGEFTKINTKLIAGQGTTSERTIYKYADTSAKPNVVYYYQIQDVSLDGQVTTLRTTHLRGNVTVVGKATTTWGELKTLHE